ncbi:replication initiator protein A [Nitratireductor aquibiodomus RA22]|uniref:Replication initiator protein A n=1 Tax=Nitratireductor aquibiodomus RA22 TaxID=1189611 RepID=I5BRN0_9HYPH|nr:replication initiator protein A [Nitratireductor aquibiodomus]EIM72232.1 replication initiator protein A [Nitratireductor aquibiodomus RA22]
MTARPRRSERDQLELFRALPTDLAPRDAQDLMAYPFFSLSKSHRVEPIEYRSGEIAIRVEAVPEHGMATIWDADILIWAASQIVEARDNGFRTSRLIATTPYEILTFIGRGTGARDYRRLRAALDRLQSTTVATTLRQPPSNPRNRNEPASDTGTTGRRMHRFSWINEWTERADAFGNPDGIELIVPDWFYKAVLDEALVLTIDRAYFGLTGGIERWLYRIVRKHGGRQKRGWQFDFQHLYVKSGSLSPFKRFAFELRAIIQRQPMPGYTLFLEIEASGRTLLAFEPAPCGQAVEAVVLSGTRTIVPSGTDPSCYREPKPHLTSCARGENRALNLESNKESNFCRGAPSGENCSPTGPEEEERGRRTEFSERDDAAAASEPPARNRSRGAS